MIPPEASATRGNLHRDVQSRPRFATLTCPNCLGTLQIKADTRAEAPCPICQYPLSYTPPENPESFHARQRIEAPAESARRHSPQPASPPPGSASPAKHRLGRILREADDYLNTPTGTAMAWGILALLLTACVVLFFHWDQERRVRANHLESIESTRPPATHHPSASSVPLLPGEPMPVDTFQLEKN